MRRPSWLSRRIRTCSICLGFPSSRKSPCSYPELFVLIRKRLDQDFFNTLTLILAEADGSKHNMMFEQNVRSLHFPVIAVHSAPC